MQNDQAYSVYIISLKTQFPFAVVHYATLYLAREK